MRRASATGSDVPDPDHDLTDTPRRRRRRRKPDVATTAEQHVPADARETSEASDAPSEQSSGRSRFSRLRDLVRRVDRHPRLLALTGWLRRAVPGDPSYGDPLSVSGAGPGSVVGRQLASVAARHPSVLREVGLGALQVWQAHAGNYPRDVGEREMAVLFTDLAGFSTWTLRVGDDLAVRMLREVGAAVEPLISHHGHVVKWLGDGIMAVFPDADSAVEAAIAARDATRAVDVDGHTLSLRAGVHVGRPHKLGDDYFGRDVNIAARVAAAAGPDEVLISSTVRDNLRDQRPRLSGRRFDAKGVPDDIRVWTVKAS